MPISPISETRRLRCVDTAGAPDVTAMTITESVICWWCVRCGHVWGTPKAKPRANQ